MKKFFILLTVVLFLLSGCSGENVKKSENSDTLKIAIYPSGTLGSSGTYYFKFNKTGEFLAEEGTPVIPDLSTEPFINKDDVFDYKSESIVIQSDDKTEIYELTDKIFSKELQIPENIDDSWLIQILYNNKTVIQNCYDTIPEVEVLIKKLAELSPVEINLRGFA